MDFEAKVAETVSFCNLDKCGMALSGNWSPAWQEQNDRQRFAAALREAWEEGQSSLAEEFRPYQSTLHKATDFLAMFAKSDECKGIIDCTGAAPVVRRVLGTLPITKDGVVAGFPPGYGGLFRPYLASNGYTTEQCNPLSMTYDGASRQIMVMGGRWTGISQHPVSSCYSTKEAADAAKGRQPNGH